MWSFRPFKRITYKNHKGIDVNCRLLACMTLRGFGVIARSSGHIYPHVPRIANIAFFVWEKIAGFFVMMVL